MGNHKTGFLYDRYLLKYSETQQQNQNKMEQVKNLWTSYLNWITEHPHLATDIETSLKWISYIATGYLRDSKNSLLWTEVVFGFGDILKFVNDRAFEQAFHTTKYMKSEQIEQF